MTQIDRSSALDSGGEPIQLTYQQRLTCEFIRGEVSGDGSILGRMSQGDPFAELDKPKLRKVAEQLQGQWPLTDEEILQAVETANQPSPGHSKRPERG